MTPEQHRNAMASMHIAHITNPAEARMRTRTAKEQHAAALEELNRQQEEVIPDADDAASLQRNILG